MMTEVTTTEKQPFHRMSSQRRRKLWSLAARAGVKCPEDVERSMIDISSTAGPSKDSLVKTQDSGVSVDLHTDGLSKASPFISAHPASFDKAFHSSAAGAQRDHHSFRFLSQQSSSGLYSNRDIQVTVHRGPPKNPGIYPVTRPPDLIRLGQRHGRCILNPVRRVGNRFDSADSSGLGSSLDWASVDVVHHNPGRHLSATTPSTLLLGSIPLSTRSFDESLQNARYSQQKGTHTLAQLPNIESCSRTTEHRKGLSLESSPYGKTNELNLYSSSRSSDRRVNPSSNQRHVENKLTGPFSSIQSKPTYMESLEPAYRNFRSLDHPQDREEYGPFLPTPRIAYPSISTLHPHPTGVQSSISRSTMQEPARLFRVDLAPVTQYSTIDTQLYWPYRGIKRHSELFPPQTSICYSTGYLVAPDHQRNLFTRRAQTLDETSLHYSATMAPRKSHDRKLVMYPIPPPTDEYITNPMVPSSRLWMARPQSTSENLPSPISHKRPSTYRSLDDRSGLQDFRAPRRPGREFRSEVDLEMTESSSWMHNPSVPRSRTEVKPVEIKRASYRPGSKRNFEAISSNDEENSPFSEREDAQRLARKRSLTDYILEEGEELSSNQRRPCTVKPNSELPSHASFRVKDTAAHRSSSIDRPLVIPDFMGLHNAPSPSCTPRYPTTSIHRISQRPVTKPALDSGKDLNEKILTRSPNHPLVSKRELHSIPDEEDILTFKPVDEDLHVNLLSEDVLRKEKTPQSTEPSSTYLTKSLTRTENPFAHHKLPERVTHPRMSIRLTAEEMNEFAEYWDHCMFTKARIVAVCLAGVASVCLVCAVGANTWIYQGTEGNITYSGFWKECSYLNGTCEFTIPFFTQRTGWQDGVLCILLLATMLGLLGIILAVTGHLVDTLTKRLYYFHSGGEAHVVAAFVTALSILIYHVTIAVHHQHIMGPVTFGAAYGVTWFACALHLLSAFLLFIDELLHRLAIMSGRVKCIRLCLNCLIRCYGRIQRIQHERQKRRLAQSATHSVPIK